MVDNGKAKKDNLKQQASKGAFWGLSSNLTVSVISFVGTAILARILSPRDFGILGMAVLVTGVVNLFGNLGLGAALVQRKNIDDEYLSTAFWSSLLLSGVLVLISLVLAPFTAYFFHEPVLKWVVICLAVNFVISALWSVHTTLLYRNIRLKTIAMVEVLSRLIRVAVMLTCALCGLKFWSIVIGMIAERCFKAIFFWRVSSWRPIFTFSKAKLKELFHFGRNIYGEGFLTYFNQNLDFIVTGRFLGVQALGVYQFAYNLPYLVRGYVQDGIAPVAFPVFSKVQDDGERLFRGFFNAAKYVSLITFPLMFGLAFCTNDFIYVAYGSRWLGAAVPLRLLCFSAALASVHCVVFSLFRAVGRPDIGFKWNLLRLPITAGLLILFSRKGIVGIALAMFSAEIATGFIAYIAMGLLKEPFIKYLKALAPGTICSTLMICFLWALNLFVIKNSNPYLRLLLNVLLGIGIYFSFLYCFFRNELREFGSFVKLCIKKSST